MSGTEPVHPDIYTYIPRTWKPGKPGEEAPTPTGHFYDHNFSVNPFGARIIDDGMHENGLSSRFRVLYLLSWEFE